MVTNVKSSERTLALFEYFSQEQRPLSINEISLGLGIPQSSTSVLVQSLVRLGYLEKNSKTRVYYPTLRVSILGTWLRRQHRRAGHLPKLLAEVYNKTGESVILAMRNGIYSQYVLAHRNQYTGREIIDSGMLYPLTCCASGWCLLTLESDQSVEKIARRTTSEAKEEHWRMSAKSAVENVSMTKQLGYAFTQGQTQPGLGAIAILLPSMKGAYAMSVGVGGRLEIIERKKELILEAMEDMAANIRKMSEDNDVLVWS